MARRSRPKESLELAALQTLIDLLRRNGVTEYSANGVALKLGPLPNDSIEQLDRRPVLSEGGQKLKDVMSRLDPIYSDPTLFEIR